MNGNTTHYDTVARHDGLRYDYIVLNDALLFRMLYSLFNDPVYQHTDQARIRSQGRAPPWKIEQSFCEGW